MQFHYDKTLKQKIKVMTQIADETPAWLTICLAKSLKEWLGQSCRVSYQDCRNRRFIVCLSYPIVSGSSDKTGKL